VLRFIEAQTGVATLSLRGMQGRLLGEVITCDGRIGLGRLGDPSHTLTRYLAQRSPDVATRVREELQRIRSEGRPLIHGIEALVADDASVIHAAIKDQVANGLVAIERHAEDTHIKLDLVRAERARKPPLSVFPTAAEVYWRTTELLHAGFADAARRSYDELEDASPAALCIRTPEPRRLAFLARSRGFEHLSVSEILHFSYHVEALAQTAISSANAERSTVSAILRGTAGAALLVATSRQVALIGGLEGGLFARAVACAHRFTEEVDGHGA
jgi:hypothetical protein